MKFLDISQPQQWGFNLNGKDIEAKKQEKLDVVPQSTDSSNNMSNFMD